MKQQNEIYSTIFNSKLIEIQTQQNFIFLENTKEINIYKLTNLNNLDFCLHIELPYEINFPFISWNNEENYYILCQKEIKKIEIINLIKAPKPGAVRVACIGDSITDGDGIDLRALNGYPAQMQTMLGDNYWVRNFGVSARTVMNSGDYPYMNELAWQDALAFQPDVVVIKLGTNDSKGYNWAHKKEFAGDLQKMVDALKALPSQPKIYLCTPIPAIKDSWTINEQVIAGEIIPIIEKAVKKNGLAGVIDLHTAFEGQEALYLPDGIHPTQQGARKIAATVAKVIDPEAKTEPRGFFGMGGR